MKKQTLKIERRKAVRFVERDWILISRYYMEGNIKALLLRKKTTLGSAGWRYRMCNHTSARHGHHEQHAAVLPYWYVAKGTGMYIEHAPRQHETLTYSTGTNLTSKACETMLWHHNLEQPIAQATTGIYLRRITVSIWVGFSVALAAEQDYFWIKIS